jgi:ribosome-binding factor A
MKQQAGRRARIEAQMQRVLSELIGREVKDPRVGNVTITAVELAADLGSARVFFVPFASRSQPAQVATGLMAAAGFLRGELGRRLQLRHAPRLSFVFDDLPDRAAHLSRLIDSAAAPKADAAHETAAPKADAAHETAAPQAVKPDPDP